MYTVFSASDVHILKGTQLPLSLAVAFWLKTREGDIPAAMSKVKQIPGTSSVFRRKCRVKSEINTPVSTPCINNVCKFESLLREQDKILSFRVSFLPNSFLLLSLFRESIWYVEGCSFSYFGRSCFVTVL